MKVPIESAAKSHLESASKNSAEIKRIGWQLLEQARVEEPQLTAESPCRNEMKTYFDDLKKG